VLCHVLQLLAHQPSSMQQGLQLLRRILVCCAVKGAISSLRHQLLDKWQPVWIAAAAAAAVVTA
jgi:hypothetical protein